MKLSALVPPPGKSKYELSIVAAREARRLNDWVRRSGETLHGQGHGRGARARAARRRAVLLRRPHGPARADRGADDRADARVAPCCGTAWWSWACPAASRPTRRASWSAGLRDRGATVLVVMTPAACEFVTPLTFQSLTGNPVVTELWGDQRPRFDLPLESRGQGARPRRARGRGRGGRRGGARAGHGGPDGAHGARGSARRAHHVPAGDDGAGGGGAGDGHADVAGAGDAGECSCAAGARASLRGPGRRARWPRG